jgi:hypothetical protein
MVSATNMKKLLIIGIIIELLAGCTVRTDAEMLEAANKVYQDYLFEYGIDGSLFSQPIIITREGGAKSYKWLAIGSEDNPAGIEVVVPKMKGAKPEWFLIGNKDAWLPLIGSKNKRRGNEEGAP